MTKQEFYDFYTKHAPVILDGATGTNLMEAGMPVGVCPEDWVRKHPEVILKMQRGYVEAGTHILYAPTFTGNRIKLAEYGLENELEEINRKLVALSKEASGGRALVAGDMTMTGQQLFPLGELQFEDLVDVYKEQARVLADAGVDLFVVETMMSLQECRAAVLAIRETCDLPIMVSLTYNEDGRTLFGTPPESAVVVLQALGVDVIGVNCSTGPAEMIPCVRKMAEYATIPILAKPNAGLPELIDGKTVYRMTPEEFAAAGVELVKAGAAFVGGCCGTTEAHIRALADAVSGMEVRSPLAVHRRVLSSERKIVEVDLDGNFMVVGERINPTGKKKLQAELREGNLTMVRQFALDQEQYGARILDVNMGMNGIDEKEMMQQVIYEVTSTVDCPLCIDTSYVDVMEAALRIYPGRALINSISLESEKINNLLPVAKKYGAMFILLPLSDEGLPKDAEEKHAVLEEIYHRAMEMGLAHEDIVVDGLVATIGANPEAAKECMATISYCKNVRKLPTICGLSNISFGLPERGAVNAAFLTMMIASGLTMAIANPSQEILMNAAFASDMLLNRPDSDIRYIEHMGRVAEERTRKEEKTRREYARQAQGRTQAGQQGDGNGHTAGIEAAGQQGTAAGEMQRVAGGSVPGGEADCEPETAREAAVREHPVYKAVLKGSKGTIVDETKAAVASGLSPDTIINEYLIAAINEVGDLFNRKKYFLPQLIGSANAMKLAIDYLEPLMEHKGDGSEMATIVIATVEGDIHDIGKNLVALMLKNYGYRVLDLGKDVPADTIVDTAMREDASIIALSALMTTTMMRMKDVVELVKEKGCTSQVIIGGACITQDFADEIGADGYSKDAAECVKLVEMLLEQ
ncbi:MAG: homocysteine S-methyltransferase family protein [Clostridiales bacterium]|nr:homocysteine S-methyltransferase family protein [Clostridiales bacterium]